MEILSKLFGSSARVKILRLFLFNPNGYFDPKAIADRSKIRLDLVRRECNLLEKSKVIKSKSFKSKGRKVYGWALNPEFPYLDALQNLLINVNSLQEQHLLGKLNKIGKLKLVVLAGVFIHDWDSRADLLIVADKINPKNLEHALRHFEAEIGREMRYVALPTSEFQYRLGMGDKLLRDILDYSHEAIVDKLGIS